MKLLDERHEEIKVHLENITRNQQEMIVVMQNVASLLANVENIKEELAGNKKEHNEIFNRMRKVENRVIWITGIMGGVVGLFEFLRAIKVIH